jgi:hypothetical protein
MLRKFVLSGKEPCPCNSGKLYRECCKLKSPKVFHSQGEALNYMGKMMQKSRIKVCLCKECKAKPKDIIKAHALQENRILIKLAVDKQVLMQDFTKEPTIMEPQNRNPEPFYFLSEVKIKDATTATCFCKNHDNKIFEKIEKAQYSLDSLDIEQLFLFAYKTFAFEYYTEIVTKQFYINMLTNVTQTAKNPMVIYQYRNSGLKLRDLDYYKDFFDTALERKDYSGLETLKLELPFRVQFTNYMMVAPPFDIKGKQIKSIDKKTNKMRYVLFTTFPNETKSYILISVLKKDLNVYNRYQEELRNAPIGLIQFYFNIFIPLYSQNLIISPALWDSWDDSGHIGVQYSVAEHKNLGMLRVVQVYLKGISKKADKEKIDSSKIPFNFFIPYREASLPEESIKRFI